MSLHESHMDRSITPVKLSRPGSMAADEESGGIDPRIEHSATLKMDLVIIPLVGMYYLLSFLDRANIGNAKIAGLTKDLKMSNTQFSTALTITYVPYILMELPMNLAMKRYGANVTLPAMVTLWGMVCACQGAVKSYGGLLACRFFLGALEGGLFPGIVLYLSSFYKRHSLQMRFAMMFSVTSLAGAFSGLLAAAIQNMHGIRGLPGWAWIFVLEGLFTTVFGIVSWFFIPATPADVPFLTQAEKDTYVRALVQDWSGDTDADGQATEVFSWSEVWSTFTDAPHVLLLCLPLFFSGVTLYGMANFTPTIVNALGFSATRTQLMTVPPYACSFVVSIVCSYFSDLYKMRGPMAIFVSIIAAAGYAIFIGTTNKHADYAALFLQIIGVYSVAPCLSTWNANNVQPHYRRATAVAMAFIATNTGGIVSTWIFLDPPRFHIACSIDLAFSLGIAACSGRWNRAKALAVEELLRDKGDGRKPGGWDSIEERQRLGDRHPRFEYTL
ncbi:major facilitator superfamily [Heterobasidion irregulare TC 32-1]|uniref:Major facilitator superfamily n=1 Tax=Heterobasidion irregulare (strain TC 32-1) TaxID=747525 RepID=W4JUR3_HETIT|nr:major facilitator superfamily [Heterobasidion irregulare TC 32-1]ETW77229.1 major facilitator superfamily [Heterobasidion irregulare TC 32-1]